MGEAGFVVGPRQGAARRFKVGVPLNFRWALTIHPRPGACQHAPMPSDVASAPASLVQGSIHGEAGFAVGPPVDF